LEVILNHNKALILLIFFLILISCTPSTNFKITQTAQVLTPTAEPTNTPILKSITFFIFHDFNANEKFESDIEKPLKNIKIKIDDEICLSDENGLCKLTISLGSKKILIDSSTSDISNLNYVFWENEVFITGQIINIDVVSDNDLNIGLGQGPFTIPLKGSSIGNYFDGKGGYGNKKSDGTHHYAIDIRIVGDGPQPVYAVVGGEVEGPLSPDKPFGDTNQVTILVRDNYGNFNIAEGHLDTILVEPFQQINKGDIIGFINPIIYKKNVIGTWKGAPDYRGSNIGGSGTNNPHLEIAIYGPGGKEGENGWGWLNILELLAKSNELYPMY
jgi:murein DD-endopeptidase MepM/ murein hydrolase activator NlpD